MKLGGKLGRHTGCAVHVPDVCNDKGPLAAPRVCLDAKEETAEDGADGATGGDDLLLRVCELVAEVGANHGERAADDTRVVAEEHTADAGDEDEEAEVRGHLVVGLGAGDVLALRLGQRPSVMVCPFESSTHHKVLVEHVALGVLNHLDVNGREPLFVLADIGLDVVAVCARHLVVVGGLEVLSRVLDVYRVGRLAL